jgi:hypothetical protein
LLCSGCGASASFADNVYDDGTVRYRVGPLSGFQRVEVEDNDLAFFNRQLGTISINSTCTEYEDVPEDALLNHLLFGTRQRNYRVDETTTLDGRGAKHVVVDLELDGVPLTLEVFLVKKDGCVYDLTHTTARNVPPQARERFLAFVEGFAVLDTRLD